MTIFNWVWPIISCFSRQVESRSLCLVVAQTDSYFYQKYFPCMIHCIALVQVEASGLKRITKPIFDTNWNFLRPVVWLLSLQESAEDEVKEVPEAFRSNRASAGLSESDDNEKNTEEKADDPDDDDDITTKTNADNSKNGRVRLVSMSKQGSGKETISDKDRMKAGIMTTNKKVWRSSEELCVKVCVDFWPIT